MCQKKKDECKVFYYTGKSSLSGIASTHFLLKTSPGVSRPFIYKCILCGMEGLLDHHSLDFCENPASISHEKIMSHVLKGNPTFSELLEEIEEKKLKKF